MKRKLAKTLFIIMMTGLFSQNMHPNSNRLDSLLHEINKEGATFNERYAHLAHTYLFSAEEQIIIFKNMLRHSFQEEDKGGVVSIHNLIASVYTFNKNFDDAQLHTDSALLFKDKTANMRALGGVYYQRALLQAARGDDRKLVIDDLYTAISHYELFPEGAFPIIVMLREIVKFYVEFEDWESMRPVMLDMLQRSRELNIPNAYIYTYPVFAQYYNGMYEKNSDKVYLDSVKMYSDSIINTYNIIDNESKASNTLQMGVTYLNYAQAIFNSDSIDWNRIEKYVDYADKLIPEVIYMERANLHILRSFMAKHKKEYSKAIKEALLAEELIDKDPQKSISRSLLVYNVVSGTYEAGGNYKAALAYMHKQHDLQKSKRTKEQYQATKELEVKYETTKKNLEISKLGEEKQKERFQAALILVFASLLIILFLIAFLYNRIKRLNKEKEAILLTERIDQKELEYKILLNETEQRMISRYLDGRESERKALGKELHDSVANDIVSIIMLNDITDDPKKISVLLKGTYNRIRQISHQLMPPMFKYISLIGLVEDYIELLNETTPSHFQLKIVDPDMLSIIEEMTDEMAKEIYYIIQEALGNIVKHADAKTIMIKLSQSEDDQFILSIADDGKGFDTHKNHKGIGLRTIRDRCSDIEADLTIESTKGKGTKITVALCLVSLAPVHQY